MPWGLKLPSRLGGQSTASQLSEQLLAADRLGDHDLESGLDMQHQPDQDLPSAFSNSMWNLWGLGHKSRPQAVRPKPGNSIEMSAPGGKPHSTRNDKDPSSAESPLAIEAQHPATPDTSPHASPKSPGNHSDDSHSSARNSADSAHSRSPTHSSDESGSHHSRESSSDGSASSRETTRKNDRGTYRPSADELAELKKQLALGLKVSGVDKPGENQTPDSQNNDSKHQGSKGTVVDDTLLLGEVAKQPVTCKDQFKHGMRLTADYGVYPVGLFIISMGKSGELFRAIFRSANIAFDTEVDPIITAFWISCAYGAICFFADLAGIYRQGRGWRCATPNRINASLATSVASTVMLEAFGNLVFPSIESANKRGSLSDTSVDFLRIFLFFVMPILALIAASTFRWKTFHGDMSRFEEQREIIAVEIAVKRPETLIAKMKMVISMGLDFKTTGVMVIWFAGQFSEFLYQNRSAAIFASGVFFGVVGGGIAFYRAVSFPTFESKSYLSRILNKFFSSFVFSLLNLLDIDIDFFGTTIPGSLYIFANLLAIVVSANLCTKLVKVNIDGEIERPDYTKAIKNNDGNFTNDLSSKSTVFNNTSDSKAFEQTSVSCKNLLMNQTISHST